MSRVRNQEAKWEVWYLLSNRRHRGKQAANEYARRFSCEQGFRDIKWEMGFSEARIEDVNGSSPIEQTVS